MKPNLTGYARPQLGLQTNPTYNAIAQQLGRFGPQMGGPMGMQPPSRLMGMANPSMAPRQPPRALSY